MLISLSCMKLLDWNYFEFYVSGDFSFCWYLSYWLRIPRAVGVLREFKRAFLRVLRNVLDWFREALMFLSALDVIS